MVYLRMLINFFRKRRYISTYRVLKFNQEPILVLGSGRSGTTLLLSVLSAHPHIHAIDFETKIFFRRKFKSSFLNHLHHLKQIYLILYGREVKKTARRWLEKYPPNVLFLEEIIEEFNGKVKIIHLVRDGRDVVTSKHPETEKKGFHISPERWVESVSMGVKFKNHPSVYAVKYEDLVDNFEDTVRNLFKFLNLEYNDTVKNFSANSQVKEHRAFHGGKIEPIFSSSVKKWQDEKYKDRINQFYNTPGAISLLKEFGYEVPESINAIQQHI